MSAQTNILAKCKTTKQGTVCFSEVHFVCETAAKKHGFVYIQNAQFTYVSQSDNISCMKAFQHICGSLLSTSFMSQISSLKTLKMYWVRHSIFWHIRIYKPRSRKTSPKYGH